MTLLVIFTLLIGLAIYQKTTDFVKRYKSTDYVIRERARSKWSVTLYVFETLISLFVLYIFASLLIAKI